ncbi:hypothetical protein SESBI_24505 [Sesbania bispinosa]|nr:hypothetical protein SESBI_24505 [Sesbania bispinosa]
MGHLLLPSLVMLVLPLLMCFESLPHIRAQSTTTASGSSSNGEQRPWIHFYNNMLIRLCIEIKEWQFKEKRLPDGSSNFSNVTGGNTCSTSQQGHFSIVVKSTAPPAPFSPVPSAAPKGVPVPSAQEGGEKKSNKKVWIIVGSVLGGLALLVLLSFLVLCISKYKQKMKMQRMERAAEVGEALQMASVGDTKAPAATVTRNTTNP